jgi:hypothetical protein
VIRGGWPTLLRRPGSAGVGATRLWVGRRVSGCRLAWTDSRATVFPCLLALECGADGLSHRVAVCHCLVMVGRGSAQLVLHTLRGAYGRGGLSHQQNKQQCRDTCGENASRGRVKWRGHNGFRIRLTKSNGWASPIFFVPRTLGRTWSTRHVRVIISVRMVIQGARGGPSRFVGSNGSWHRPKRGERS